MDAFKIDENCYLVRSEQGKHLSVGQEFKGGVIIKLEKDQQSDFLRVITSPVKYCI